MIGAHAAEADPRPLGELLVSQGLLTRDQLAAALAEHMQTGIQIGEILVARGYVSGEAVAQALATQQGGLASTEYGVALGFAAPTTQRSFIAPPPVTGPSPDPPPETVAEAEPAFELIAETAEAQPAFEPQPVIAEVVAPAPVEPEPLVPQPSPEVEALRAELAAARQALDARAAADAEMEDLRVQIRELHGMADHVGDVQAAQAAAEDERDALRQQLAAITVERETLLQLAAAQPVSDSLPERLAVLESRLDQAVDLLGALKQERETKEELERQLAAAQAIQAAAKRSIEVLEDRLADRDRAYDEVVEELARARAATPPRAEEQAGGPYVVFATVGGAYDLVEREGAIPQPGDVIVVGDTEHVVNRVSAAGFGRPCVYTIPR